MSSQILEEFIKSSAPGFRCYAAGNELGPQFIAKVCHILRSPASPESIAKIYELLGSHADKVAEFYQRQNGFILYRDTLSDAAGIELLPIEQWEKATENMRDWFDYLMDNPENDPDHVMTGISIATVPFSGNYFVMPVEGPSSGKIFYADHDGWYESAFADDFDGFLAHVTQKPVKLLNEELGCCTRYSDGTTDAQWIPEEYFPDVTKFEI
jgi:hypothetical protein